MLQTFDQNDMNTQAIRELTTEVQGVKKKAITNANNITTLQTEVASLKPQLKLKNIPIRNLGSAVVVNAGSSTSAVTISSELVTEGQTLVAVQCLYTMTTGGSIVPALCIREQIATDAQNNKYVVLAFYNPTAEAISVTSVALNLFYTE